MSNGKGMTRDEVTFLVAQDKKFNDRTPTPNANATAIEDQVRDRESKWNIQKAAELIAFNKMVADAQFRISK